MTEALGGRVRRAARYRRQWWHPIRRHRARSRIILAAKLVESGYVDDIVYQHDPDDLRELRAAVADLRSVEAVRWDR